MYLCESRTITNSYIKLTQLIVIFLPFDVFLERLWKLVTLNSDTTDALQKLGKFRTSMSFIFLVRFL